MAKTKKKTPYGDRTDLEKLQSQWVKLSGLHDEEQWSAAVVRAATAAEIAVNIAIRSEFKRQSNLQATFVDGLLKWANGIQGKFEKLLLPLLKDHGSLPTVADLEKRSREINKVRNSIVHTGAFCSKSKATTVIRECREIIITLVGLYESGFVLKER